MPIATGWSLQYSSVFYIYTIGSIILICKNNKWKGTNTPLYFFLMLGILTSYCDLLTYPIVSFGIPIMFYLCLNNFSKIHETMQTIIRMLLYWGIGYVGMWAGKWILSSLLTSENVIHLAIFKLSVRSSLEAYDASISIFSVLLRNCGIYMLNPAAIIMCLFVIIYLIKLYKAHALKEFTNYLKCYIIVLLLPFVWYIVASNHSYIHCWFTYRDIAVFTFCGMCALINALQDNKLSSKTHIL